ncbi:hypothetical protein K0U83_24580 [bacterium]|jgi:hypothetical protein|nr:hypothetical protein [bacterium]
MTTNEWGDETVSAWRFSLMIDTDSYAGNFERALCAACTGVVDDTASEAEAEGSRYDGPDLSDLVGGANVDGCWRPARCWPTPGKGDHNTVRIYLEREPTAEEVEAIRSRAVAFAARGCGEWVRPFRVLGIRLVRKRTATQSRAL